MTAPQPPQVPLEEAVRKFSELRMPVRKIARELGRMGFPHTSTSTVQRTITRINTGPNPIIPAGTAPGGMEDGSRMSRHLPVALIAAAILLLAACAGAALLIRALRMPAPVPPVTACVHYAPDGTITGITDGSRGCPAGWKNVTLTSGG